MLTQPVTSQAKYFLRHIAFEHEIEIISGKISSGHIHMLLSYRPTKNIGKIVQWLKGMSSRTLLSEFTHLKKQLWLRHLGACGYLAIGSGNITNEMIQQYIKEQ